MWPSRDQGQWRGTDAGGADPVTALEGDPSHLPAWGTRRHDTCPQVTALGNGVRDWEVPHREFWQYKSRFTPALSATRGTSRHRVHPGSRGRDQLLLGTGTLHPATPAAGSDSGHGRASVSLPLNSTVPTSGSHHCLLAQQEEKEERACASSALCFGLTSVLL